MKTFEIVNGRDARPTDPKSVLEQRLADLEAIVRRRQRDWLAARAAAAAEPQDNLADVIARERAARIVLEQELVARRAQYEKDIARNHAVRAMVDEQLREAGLEVKRAREAEASAAAAVERLARAEAEAIARLAAREAEFASELSAVTETRDGLEQQLSYVESALASARQRHELATREVEQLTRREGELSAQYAHETATRATLERRVAEVETALAEASAQATRERAVAAEREARFQTEVASIASTRDSLEQQLRGIETALSQQIDARLALERAIAEQRSAATEAEQRLRDEIGAMTAKASAERTRLEDQVSRERRDHHALRAEEEQQHRSAMATAAARLAEREAQFQTEVASIASTRDSLEQQLRGIETALSQQIDARLALERAIAEQRLAATEAEQRLRDEIGAMTEKAGAERTRLEDRISRERTLGAERLAARGAEFEAELERLSGIHAKALARFQASLAERDSQMEAQARASAALQTRLDASEAENRRQFEQTPVPLVRFTRDGVVEDANHAFAALVGCRTPGDLRDGKFAATLFESRNDLAWLIDRSANAMKTGSVETTCIRKDGVRLAVRLSARPAAAGCVEIAAENLTHVRVLEDRLREAHRMEAVGRVASEIAMTCEKLLQDVYREAQRLLTTITGGGGPRDHAATLLDDVTLAGSILHQLVAYGDEQTAALAPVDVNGILRDLQPVLKQVAGDAITLDLRKHSSPVNVDVNAERVERLLVNVASYGRQRMPHGGRLRIELSTVVVDGKFIAQHPNVRQGPHALITVTEVARPATEGQLSDHADRTEPALASGRPRVELGALQELIAECGGHLWITAEPGGSMVVKMRLPLRAAWGRQANARARQGLGRITARLLGR